MPSWSGSPGRPPLRLLGAELGVAGGLQDPVERAGVVADVVGLADHRRVRLGERLDQVDPSNLGGVLADLQGEQVHRPLDRRRGLRPPGAAVGDGWRGVGHDGRRAALDVRDRVHARRHRSGHERGEDRADLGERTRVLDHEESVVGDLAVARATDRDVLDLGPAVAEGHHRLAARLLPAHRAAEPLAQLAEHDLLGVGADLGAEPAADVGREHAHLVGLQLVADGERVLDALCVLGGSPLVKPTVDPRRRRPADLERARRHPLVDEAGGDGDLAVGEELFAGHVRHAEGGRVEHRVAAGLLVEVHRRRQGFLRVDDGVEHVVVDEHDVGGVCGLLAGLGDDGDDGLADVADLAAGEHGAGDGRVERRRRRLEPEVLGREHAEHAGHAGGLAGVDRGDRAVGDGRSGVGDEGRALELGDVVEIVEVLATGCQELRVLLADDPFTENAAGHSNPPVARSRGPRAL